MTTTASSPDRTGPHDPRPLERRSLDLVEASTRATFRERFIAPYVSAKATALEISPGRGLWTRELLGFERLICVDTRQRVFVGLLETFGAQPNVSFCQSSGTDLPGIPPASIDFVWGFESIVHLQPSAIAAYLSSLRRVVREEATLVLRYADEHKPAAAANPSFAPTTAPIMNFLLRHAGFEVVEQACDLTNDSNLVRFHPRQ